MKMKYLLLTLAVFCGLTTSAGGQSNTAGTPPQNPTLQLPPSEQPPAPEEPAAEKQLQPAAKKTWPQPFVPTERINADSVVSFPVDI